MSHESGQNVSAESALAAEQETQFMFQPPVVVAPGGVARAGGPLPTVLGYNLLGEVGRGGFGVVYRAEQTGLKRVVALKVLRGGAVADDAEVARFRAEAQAVARLQHPHIVQVYEVGECAAGDGGTLPFFALEYVEGGTLGDRLDGTPQPPREAALLIEKLARAVHHAHEQGILHRDLKPTNILMTTDCTPKITDFGLAKRIDGEGQSASGAIVGTPCYMAPEQASGRKQRATPAVDVYSLGSIFYEMLTGRPPFRAATALETVVQVVNDDAVSVRRLNPAVPRDLATICRKCLSKEPSRRYATAAALADDLRRYLDGVPILARPATRTERVWRWCRREPWVAGLAAGLAVVVIASLAALTALYLRAEDRREAAEVAQANATRAETEARQQAAIAAGREKAEAAVKRYLVQNFLSRARPHVARNRGITFEEVLDKAALQIGDDFKDQPALEAQLRHEFGTTSQSLANYPVAESHLRRAVQLRRDLLGPDDPDSLDSRCALASVLLDQNKLSEAEPLVKACLEDCRRVLPPGHDAMFSAEANAVKLAGMKGEADKALAASRHLADNPATRQSPELLAVAKTLRTMADIYRQGGTPEEVGAKAEAALRSLHKEFVESPALGPSQPATLSVAHMLGEILLQRGKPAEAEPVLRQCWEGRSRVLGPDHPESWKSLSMLIPCLLDQGKSSAAEKVLRPEYERRVKSAKPDLAWADFLALYGWTLTLAANPSEAEPVLRECKDIRRKVLNPNDWLIANVDSLIGVCLRMRGQFVEAEPLLLDSYAALAKARGAPPDRVRQARERIVKLYEEWGKNDLADKWRAPGKPPVK